MMYVRFPLSLRQVEDLLSARGIDICHERINGKTYYLWRAVDHEGEVLEVFATKRRDRRTALSFLKRAIKRCGRSASVVTDGLTSYRAAMNVIGNAADQTCGRWLNNRAENSHQPFRGRDRVASTRSLRAVDCRPYRSDPVSLTIPASMVSRRYMSKVVGLLRVLIPRLRST